MTTAELDSARQARMTKKVAIHWFGQDLRLADNPALFEASAFDSVLPIYILDDVNAADYSLGGASRWQRFRWVSLFFIPPFTRFLVTLPHGLAVRLI